MFRLLLRHVVESRDHVLPLQLLGNTVAYHVPVSDAGKPVEMDAVGLLYGRHQFVGHVRDQTEDHVPQRRVLGARSKTHRTQLFGKTTVEGEMHETFHINNISL